MYNSDKNSRISKLEADLAQLRDAVTKVCNAVNVFVPKEFSESVSKSLADRTASRILEIRDYNDKLRNAAKELGDRLAYFDAHFADGLGESALDYWSEYISRRIGNLRYTVNLGEE